MNPTLNDLSKLLFKRDYIKGDVSHYGVVVGTIENDDGYVTGYEVSLGGASDIIECRKFAGANIGDVVLVTNMASGAMAVTACRDGDGDTVNLITGLDDGTFSINGECLTSIGSEDRAMVAEGGMGFIGSETKMIVNKGAVDITHNGESVLSVRDVAGDATVGTQIFNTNILEGRTQALNFVLDTAIYKVSVTYTRRLGLIKHSYSMEISTSAQSGKPPIWYTVSNGIMTIHNQYTPENIATIVTSVIVEFSTDSSKMLDIGNGKIYSDGQGNMYAKSFTQVNPPVMSAAPSGGNGINTPESSRTIKHDIKPCEFDVKKLYEVPVVQFKFNEDYLCTEDERFDKDVIGLIAEDVETALPIAVDHNRDHPMWNSQILIPAMLKLVQEQHEEIETLKEKINGLQ